MRPFKRNPESPQEIAAEQRLDEATREVGWAEYDEARKKDAEAVQTDVGFARGMADVQSAVSIAEAVEGERGP